MKIEARKKKRQNFSLDTVICLYTRVHISELSLCKGLFVRLFVMHLLFICVCDMQVSTFHKYVCIKTCCLVGVFSLSSSCYSFFRVNIIVQLFSFCIQYLKYDCTISPSFYLWHSGVEETTGLGENINFFHRFESIGLIQLSIFRLFV